MADRLVPSLLACLIGTAGGLFFAWAGMPLPWMLGGMVATAAGALAGLRLALPVPWRNAGLAVLGVSVGAAYGPESFRNAPEWLASLASVLLYTVAVGAICTAFLVRTARYDTATAFFSGMPGGMNEMVIVGQRFGGDARRIALSHGVRVIVVITLVAAGFRLFDGYVPPPPAATTPLDAWDTLWLILAGGTGVVLSIRLRLPAPFFLGPLLGSLLLHAAGLSHAAPPMAVIAPAQVVVGVSLGVRFVGITRTEITTTAFHAVRVSFLQLAVTGLAAGVAGAALALDPRMLFLAFAPAGVAEMTLIAMALGYDPAFVAVHQLVRLLLVFAAAPVVFGLTRRSRRKGK